MLGCMEMDVGGDLDVGSEEVIENEAIGNIRMKKQCNSKFLKHLMICLLQNKHNHMLSRVTNGREDEFKVKFTNKKSPKWEKRDISLFKEMDGLFSKPRKVDSYDEDCKVRFKANMNKLCSSGFLERVSDNKESPSVTIIKYRILRNPYGNEPTKVSSKRKTKNHLNVNKAGMNLIKTNGIPSILNGCFSLLTDCSDLSMQEGNVDDITEANGYPVVSYNGNISSGTVYSDEAVQERDDYYDCENKMIGPEDPVWGGRREEGVNKDIKDISNFLSEGDSWMTVFSDLF